MDKNQLLDMIVNTPPEELAKATQEALGINGIRIIKDLWTDKEMHTNPERNDTKTGPAMHSSGAGADKAMHEYSNPAPQVGLTEQYDDFNNKNIEGWGKMHESFKSMGEKMETGLAALLDHMKKADEEKKEEKHEEKEEHEKKEEMKAVEPASTPDPTAKAEKIAAAWNDLGELEAAYAKAEVAEGSEPAALQEVSEHIEKAEHELEKEDEKKDKKDESAHMKANVYINLGWKSLAKATGLNAYDLKGYGNQLDAAVTGDSTSDQSKHDLKKAEAKATYFSSKADRIRKSLGIVKKDETVVTPVTDVVAAVAVTPEISPELATMKEDLAGATATIKSMSDRVSFLNQRIEEVSGRKMTPMVPVILKSAGIKSDSIADSLNSKIETSVEAGILSEANAEVARSLVGRYMAVGKGHIDVSIVNQQLAGASMEVQDFFKTLEATI